MFVWQFIRVGLAVGAVAALVSCDSGNKVSNDENARRAYLGIDRSVDKALDLAMQGYNMSSNANFPMQQTTGDVSGTLTAVGQVSRGMTTSGNSEVRVSTAYASYQDSVAVDDGAMLRVTYDGAQGSDRDLNLSLRGIPTGTFDGTLVRTLTMSGDLTGDVTLDLHLSGQLQAAGTGIARAPGTTHIMGTAKSSYGTYTIDVMR